ncbi:MAG: hypothetical protein L0212_12675, partial [Acidobacteria bacterium]|nr:hypothetical protein [Acidobacteriota bacterium]
MPEWSWEQASRLMQRALALAGASLIGTALLAPQGRAQSKGGEEEFSQRVTQRRDASGTEVPSRVTETRSQDGNRKSRTRVIEAPGLDGRYQPLLEREEQAIQVDAQTTRKVVKEFGRNADGSRSLLRQTEEETRTLPGGRERTTRSISRPDVNGRMQAVERAVEESRETGPDTRETNRTVLLPDLSGSFLEVERVHEVERRKEGGAAEVTASHSRQDGNGRWGTYEVRKQTLEPTTDGGEVADEQVLRRDLNDHESIREHKVTRKWKDAAGQEHQVEETYSRANSGANVAEGDRLPLAQRTMSVTTTQADGSQRVV